MSKGDIQKQLSPAAFSVISVAIDIGGRGGLAATGSAGEKLGEETRSLFRQRSECMYVHCV